AAARARASAGQGARTGARRAEGRRRRPVLRSLSRRGSSGGTVGGACCGVRTAQPRGLRADGRASRGGIRMTRRPLESQRIPLVGTQVIEASAGTGKTYTITSLVVRLVTEGRLGIEQVLAVTFTNAAAAELAGRIRSRVLKVRDAM